MSRVIAICWWCEMNREASQGATGDTSIHFYCLHNLFQEPWGWAFDCGLMRGHSQDENYIVTPAWVLQLTSAVKERDIFASPYSILLAARDPAARELILEDPEVAMKILGEVE